MKTNQPTNQPTPKKIMVTMDGGLIHEVTGIPEGYIVEVHDYDTDGADEEDLHEDEWGDEYHLSIHGPDEECEDTKPKGSYQPTPEGPFRIGVVVKGDISGTITRVRSSASKRFAWVDMVDARGEAFVIFREGPKALLGFFVGIAEDLAALCDREGL